MDVPQALEQTCNDLEKAYLALCDPERKLVPEKEGAPTGSELIR
jgi:hypothetical protein